MNDHFSYNIGGTLLKCNQLGTLVWLWIGILKFHEHIRGIVGKASGLASLLLRAPVNRNPEFMVICLLLTEDHC